MAGTLLLLKDAGYEIHYMSVANGCCGSTQTGREETARIRREEGMRAAELAAFAGVVGHEREQPRRLADRPRPDMGEADAAERLQRIHVEAAGPAAEILAMLKTLPGVGKAELIEEHGEKGKGSGDLEAAPRERQKQLDMLLAEF